MYIVVILMQIIRYHMSYFLIIVNTVMNIRIPHKAMYFVTISIKSVKNSNMIKVKVSLCFF
jgi:hypothetical protein